MLKSLLPHFVWSKTEPSQFESSNLRPSRSRVTRSRLSRSRLSKPRLIVLAGRAAIVALCGLAAFLTLPAKASAQQSFTLQAPALSENAIDPGGTSFATVTVGTLGGFNSAVDLSCQVAPVQPQTIVSAPECTVSPASVTPPASASATITTTAGTSTVSYNVTITGTAASNSQTTTTPPLYMTVIDVAPQFTITVEKPVAPASVPAGNSGVGTISINPINGYFTPAGQTGAGITLSCSSISPLVTIPPICKFNPTTVAVNPDGQVPPVSLTIISFGPVVTTTGSAVAPPSLGEHFWGHSLALWLPLPMLALVGLGAEAGGKRSRKVWWLLGLFVLTGTFFLMPACGNTTTTTSTPEGVTPNNTYTFTISGVDQNGVVSSNAGAGSTNPTVTLAVTTATTN